jgi:chemosensory pili system protein ChpB (putative protein-glutamate methylesterase)
MSEPTRVILLARPGEARTRLESALREAGADIALVADPTSATLDEARAVEASAVLVALEPMVEDGLDRFEALLADPSMTVIFDEAELAAQREGWDAARWVRHLAAKLNRHDDVLPPGWEVEADWQPAPGPLPPPGADARGLDIAPFAGEATELADSVPRDDGFELVVDADGMLTLDGGDDETEGPTTVVGGISADGILAAEDMDWSSSGGFSDMPLQDNDFSDLDPDALSVALDSGVRRDETPAEEPLGDPPPASALGATLSLADDDAPIMAAPAGGQRVEVNLDALEARVSGLALADTDSYGHGPLRGAVLVEAGLGGPDAVRQLLAALPEAFPRAVLVRLQLDGGRYDRLVKQMERASTLPVALAVAGQATEPGTVYFLPPTIGVALDRARLVFTEDAGAADALYTTLPAADSAMLFLSGSTAPHVALAMACHAEGALVAAQAPDSCYDATAASLLIEQGGAAGTPAELAERLADRWPS